MEQRKVYQAEDRQRAEFLKLGGGQAPDTEQSEGETYPRILVPPHELAQLTEGTKSIYLRIRNQSGECLDIGIPRNWTERGSCILIGQEERGPDRRTKGLTVGET